MDICKVNNNFSFKLKGSCKTCILGKEKNEIFTIKNIVPNNLCPFAYYAIIPYWASFLRGARFRWEKNQDEVSCQCPKPEGVVFLVKRIIRNRKVTVEAEIKSLGKFACPYQYSTGQIFKINKVIFCPALFPSFWSQFVGLPKPISKKMKISCCLKPKSFRVDKI